ncbi:hypothetical protein Tco_0983073 [Tanacetum coccineum]
MSSNEASSGVTYTSIFSYYEEPSDAGSPRVIVYGYDGLAMYPVDPYVEAALQAPPSLNYVSGPKEPEQASPSPDYVPGPEYPKYLAPYDAEISVEDQLYAIDASSTALSLGYIADSYPEEDPEDESEGSSTTDYPDEKEASEEDEEEEHLAPADSTTVSLAVDPVPSAEETKPFETDESAATPPPPAYRTTYKIVAEIRLRAASPLPLPSPPLSPLLLPSTDHRADIPEAVLLPQKRLCLALGPRFEVGENSFDVAARPTRSYRADYGQDTNEIYVRFKDAQDDQALLRGQVNMLCRDRHYHLYAAMLVESEARVAREA